MTCGALAVLAATSPALAQAATSRAVAFAIDSQGLETALTRFASAADVQVVFSPELVRGKQANRVAGLMPPAEALRQMLAGSGLVATQVGERTFSISQGASQVADAATLEEVIVTAQKRSQRLQDVPLAVSVIDGADAARRGVDSITGLVDETPGVSINYAFGGTNYGLISIRGIGGADDYKPNGNPSVALHIDGVYQTSNAYLGMPLFDLDRIEILKGPQGTLYGRNTTAGVINVITKGPGDTAQGAGRFEIGSYDYVAVESAVGGPLNDKVGVRLAVLAEQGGGFMTGAGAGKLAGFRPIIGGVTQTQVPPIVDPGRREGFGDKNLVAGRATVALVVAPETRLTLKLFGSRDHGDTRQYDRISNALDTSIANAGENDDPYEFYSSEYPTQRIDIYGASAILTHRLADNLNLTVIGNSQGTTRSVQGNGDGSPYPASRFDADETLNQQSLEVRLGDETGGRVDWIAGAFYVADDIDFDTHWTSYTARTKYDNLHKQSRNSFALFGQVDYDLTDRLTLSGGLRYTRDEATFSGRNDDLNPWGISTFTTTFATTNPFIWDRTFEDDNVSGRVTAKYIFTPNLNAFVSAGTGYRGGGFDGTSIFTQAETLPFDSETVVAYETGVRWASPRLRLSLDAFFYRFKELQATTRLANDTNGRANVGEAESKGLEFALNAVVFETANQSLDFDLAAAFLDTEILSFSSARVADVLSTVGDPLPGAPDVTATAALNHALTFANGWRLNSRLSVSHHGEESNRLNATPANTAEAYTLVNARLDLQTAANWTVYAYGRNLTDAVYFPELNGAARLVGAPATYGVGLRYSF
ncbi:TonB-dependent receptor [Brevundimonas sp. SORGH_AS_0993]|uniref:TonB-dependent receptor domain-containing protein n=1 Tax=Brevundimonas sp. SORGH_AS_0993 TaxID=3041794 RepID=UPI0027D8C23D|nr:TonB-dependent receptor [Brevundimonas sp. SORGH_AS_0993]